MKKRNGDNHHGNQNELNLVESLNNMRYGDLNSNLKEFIKDIAESRNIPIAEDTVICSTYEKNTKLKQDLYIEFSEHPEQVFCISLKMGTGNSVHQEKCEVFVDYIVKNCNASEVICDYFRFFIWGDGTTDGSGSMEKEGDLIKSRFGAGEFKKKYPKEREKLQKFLNDNEEKLLRHFLFEGHYNSQVDFIYHGTPLTGTWIMDKDIINYQLNNPLRKESNRSCLSVGRMTIQPWNVSKKGTSEKKRGQIQAKYGSMKDDFSLLMKNSSKNVGTFQGDTQEFDFSRLLNKNKKSKMWSELLGDGIDSEDAYIIKVTKRVESKLSNKKVFPKSDAYIVIADIKREDLLAKEYVLTESDLRDYSYQVVFGSGISIKIKESNKYSIQKFTCNSFMKAFNKLEKPLLVFLGALLFSKPSEIAKNNKIFSDLGVDQDQFLEYFHRILDDRNLDLRSKTSLDKIRGKSQDIIKTAIEENEELHRAIFTGEGWFDSPYFANYKYIGGVLEKNLCGDFLVTTGSGRSKGKYSIEIKPKK